MQAKTVVRNSPYIALSMISRLTVLEEREFRLYAPYVHPSMVQITGCNVWLHLWSWMLSLRNQWQNLQWPGCLFVS